MVVFYRKKTTSSYCFLNSYAFLAIIISKYLTIILSAGHAMKTPEYFLIIGIVLALTACSTQEVKPSHVAIPASSQNAAPIIPNNPIASGQNPAMTITKDGKKLNLVRIMDGAACKNELEGAKGSFLIYADPSDIERIKREKGTKVFADFENKIQTFSAEVLQNAVDATNLDENPFALGKDQAQEELAKALSNNFQQAANTAIAQFKNETSLTIEIAAYSPSLEFYQRGCQATLPEEASPEATPQ